MEISKKEARLFALYHQKLLRKVPITSSKEESVKAIGEIANDLSYIQIDTISVVQRAHHHVFWSRIPTYKPLYLDDALNKKNGVFEYWSHAAAYLPMSHYKFSLVPKKALLTRDHPFGFKRDEKLLKDVYKRIKEEGPLSASDFKNTENIGKSGWWDWKPAKKALEQLFLEGSLMVSFRKGFRKYYDLPSRVLPENTCTKMPTEKEYGTHIIDRALKARGIASLKEICYNRSRQNFFDFKYQIECYVPAPKRQFGYFSLPLLFQDKFIGMIDCKAHRKDGFLEVKSCHFTESNVQEKTIRKYEELLVKSVKLFSTFNGCTKPPVISR